MNSKHCCDKMDFHIDEQDLYFNYDPVLRRYFINLRHSPNIIQCLWFCPWCGKKLPSILNNSYFNILKSEYELEDPRGDQEHLVPNEFKSDEWWKKRNL